MAAAYRIRLRTADTGESRVLDVSFSQLVQLLPPVEEDREKRRAQRKRMEPFWQKRESVDGPLGNVKLIRDDL